MRSTLQADFRLHDHHLKGVLIVWVILSIMVLVLSLSRILHSSAWQLLKHILLTFVVSVCLSLLAFCMSRGGCEKLAMALMLGALAYLLGSALSLR